MRGTGVIDRWVSCVDRGTGIIRGRNIGDGEMLSRFSLALTVVQADRMGTVTCERRHATSQIPTSSGLQMMPRAGTAACFFCGDPAVCHSWLGYCRLCLLR